jgi:hypothetical protein
MDRQKLAHVATIQEKRDRILIIIFSMFAAAISHQLRPAKRKAARGQNPRAASLTQIEMGLPQMRRCGLSAHTHAHGSRGITQTRVEGHTGAVVAQSGRSIIVAGAVVAVSPDQAIARVPMPAAVPPCHMSVAPVSVKRGMVVTTARMVTAATVSRRSATMMAAAVVTTRGMMIRRCLGSRLERDERRSHGRQTERSGE